MGWIKESENFRDMGHTWFPEIEDEPLDVSVFDEVDLSTKEEEKSNEL